MPTKRDRNNEQVRTGTGWHAAPGSLEFDRRLTIYDRAVWHNFAAHFNRKTGACFPSRDLQAKEIGCSTNKVTEARKKLIELGLISKHTVNDKNGMIERWQWVLEDMTRPVDQATDAHAPLPPERSTNRPVHQQTVTATANQTELKPQELKPLTAAASAAGDVGKGKPKDDDDPMTVDDFIAWCERSTQRHVHLIGAWAEATDPDCQTKGQWRAFIKRNLRSARDLAPFTDTQIEAAYGKLKEAKGDGWLKKYTMETLIKFAI